MSRFINNILLQMVLVNSSTKAVHGLNIIMRMKTVSDHCSPLDEEVNTLWMPIDAGQVESSVLQIYKN